MPGAGELFNTPVFDPENISPLAAALAAEGCPFNGQVFSVGWRVGRHLRRLVDQRRGHQPRWLVGGGLIQAMNTLPRSVAVASQRTKIIEAIR